MKTLLQKRSSELIKKATYATLMQLWKEGLGCAEILTPISTIPYRCSDLTNEASKGPSGNWWVNWFEDQKGKWIYKFHIFEQRNKETNVRKIIAVKDTIGTVLLAFSVILSKTKRILWIYNPSWLVIGQSLLGLMGRWKVTVFPFVYSFPITPCIRGVG